MTNNTQQLKELYDKLGEIIKGNEWNNHEQEKGKWYVIDHSDVIDEKRTGREIVNAIVNYQGGIKDCFGLNHISLWDEKYNEGKAWKLWRLATPEEVKDALEKHGKSIGVKLNAKIHRSEKLSSIIGASKDSIINEEYWTYLSDIDALFCNAICVYCKGVWCEVIPQLPEITIGGHVVEFVKGYADINGSSFTKDWFKSALTVYDYSKATVCMHGQTIAPETIQEIITRLEG